jgi:hypothetical protein
MLSVNFEKIEIRWGNTQAVNEDRL